MRRLRSRPQRTIAKPVQLQGVGFLTGADVTVCFQPAAPNTGVIFVRTDLDPVVQIAARIDNVTGTQRRTTLGTMPHGVSLVEHALAALAGLRIDNCYVELNAAEPPGLDGSSHAFVKVLQQAGIETQAAERAMWTVEEPVIISRPNATLALHPTAKDELRVSYFLDYGATSPIMPQRCFRTITPQVFAGNIAKCRTFLLKEEADELLRQGIGKRTKVTDLIVFGPHGPIDNRLRGADEPACHKILDIVGDLSLLGCDLRGHVVAYRSGHGLNAELAQQLQQQIRRASTGKEMAA